MTVRILFIGDIMGRPGREAVKQIIPSLKKDRSCDFVIANGENAAGGKGITPSVAEELYRSGIDVITNGNHVWANKEIFAVIGSDPRLLRPANFPDDMGVPGMGYGFYPLADTYEIAVLNLIGRVYMRPYDCPFRVGKHIIDEMRARTSIIIVDFHAEITSEKIALGWFFDGSVSALIGTHTHIPTADERILPGGTAYITDVGMTGPYDSVIGVKKEIIIHGFLTQMPVRHVIATDDVKVCGVIITIDPASGKALEIERISIPT